MNRAQAAGPWVDACANSCPMIRSFTLGGVIALLIGQKPTKDGALTIFGSARRSVIKSRECGSAGRSRMGAPVRPRAGDDKIGVVAVAPKRKRLETAPERGRSGGGMPWRLMKWTASVVLALVLVAALAGVYLFYRAMPVYSGAERLGTDPKRVCGATPMARHTSSPAQWTTRRAHSDTACERTDVPDGVLRRVGQGRMSEIRGADLLPVESSFARSVSIERPRPVFGPFRPGRRSALKLMPRG